MRGTWAPLSAVSRFSQGTPTRELGMAQEGLWGWHPHPPTSLNLGPFLSCPPHVRSYQDGSLGASLH